MHHEIEKAVNILKNTGLANMRVLEDADKILIAEIEGSENMGVHACLSNDVTIMVTHNSAFREPEMPIVKNIGNSFIFPPVPFHELRHKNAISSSPSKRVHDFLVKRFGLVLNQEDATLFIGFDIDKKI